MSLIGNIIWLCIGGFICGLAWIFAGLVCCLTIIGIPLGMQCFKFASLSFFPFGRDVVFSTSNVSLLINLIWILLIGFECAVGCMMAGVICCLTIIGIPFGQQFFKFAKLWLMPFGAQII